MSLLEKHTEHVKSERMRPEKEGRKKAAIGTDCKRIENDTLINQA